MFNFGISQVTELIVTVQKGPKTPVVALMQGVQFADGARAMYGRRMQIVGAGANMAVFKASGYWVLDSLEMPSGLTYLH